MRTAKTIHEIKSLSDEQLIREHDEVAQSTTVGTSYYLDELRARDSSKVAESVRKFTTRIFWLTVVITVATLINLALNVVLYFVRG